MIPSLEGIMVDARQAGRALRKAPGLAAAVVLTLALAIAGNTAIFSIVKALLIEPLPYRDPGRLVFVWADLTQAGYPRGPLAGPELEDLRRRSRLYSGFGGIWPNTAALTGDGEPEQLRIGLVTADFFSVLGAEAALGRTFAPEDQTPSAPPSILLSWGLWQRRYAGDRAIVGRRIEVSGAPATVVGVMPAGFKLLLPPDASVPDDLQAWRLLPSTIAAAPRGQQFLRVVGRLRPGVPLSEGRQEVAAIGRQVAAEFNDYAGAGWRLFAVGLQSDGTRDVRPVVVALFAGVTLLLLIACVNVASLLVARAAARSRETAVRIALGAGRTRLFRQNLVEGILLAALGGLVSVPLGWAALRMLLRLRPDALGRIDAARFDLGIFAFTAAIALGWGVLLSLAPAAEVLRTSLRPALDRDAQRAGAAGVHYRTRAVLVVVQVALSTVLLVSTGLLLRGLVFLTRVDPGFDADRILSFRLALSPRYRVPDAANAFSRRLRAELGAVPGVTSVGAASHLPYDSLPNWSTPYLREGVVDPSLAREADARAVDPGFFDTVGASLVEGRNFAEDDDNARPFVAIVDERLARRLWPGESAVGRQVRADPRSTGSPTAEVTIVGVVRHLRHRRPTEEVREQMYFPERQVLRNPMAYVVRTTGDPVALAPAVRRVLARLDPQLPIHDVRPLAEYVSAARAVRRFTAVLAAVFAGVALGLAGIGMYGVLAFSVARRRHEFGVRLALGARVSQVVGLVMREGLRLAVVGLVLGLAGAALAARALQAQLFGVTPADLPSYAAAVAVLAVASALACWLPARRSMSVSPLEALRPE